MRARGGGALEGGGEERGAGMMQCLATRLCAHAQGTRRAVGGAGGGEERGGAPALSTLRPQRLATVAAPGLTSETSLLLVVGVLGPPPGISPRVTFSIKGSHFPRLPSQLIMGTKPVKPASFESLRPSARTVYISSLLKGV